MRREKSWLMLYSTIVLYIIVSSIFLLPSLVSTEQFHTGAQEEVAFFKIQITFIEGKDRNVSEARVYIKEYPQYGTNPPDGSHIDLNDAFYNDDPYTGLWEDEIAMPSNLIGVGEYFHACIEDTDKGVTLACYKLQNSEAMRPEKVSIDFNNFP
jgi:hypothetical protein